MCRWCPVIDVWPLHPSSDHSSICLTSDLAWGDTTASKKKSLLWFIWIIKTADFQPSLKPDSLMPDAEIEYIKLCIHSHGIIIIQVPHINCKNLRLMLQFFCHENQSTGPGGQGRHTAPILDLEVLREPAAWESQGWAHWNPGCSYWCKITDLSLFNVCTLDSKKNGPRNHDSEIETL